MTTDDLLKNIPSLEHAERHYIEITLVLKDYGCQRGDEDDGSGMPAVVCSDANGWCIRCKALDDWSRIAAFIEGSSICD